MESTNPWLRTPLNQPLPMPDAQPKQSAPPFEPKRPNPIKRTLGPILAAIIAFSAKFKAFLCLLSKLKLLTSDGRDGALDVVRRLRGADCAGLDLSQPDHPDHRRVRRPGDVPALAGAAARR